MDIDRRQLKIGAGKLHIVSARNQLMNAKRNLQQAGDYTFAKELLIQVDACLKLLHEV